LLAPLDLRPWLDRLGWIVVGGESGGGARAMQPGWVRAIRDQCAAAGVPFWMKQTGSDHTPWPGVSGKGENLLQLPADLRIRALPCLPHRSDPGKGRHLEG
jgi:protein gp37